MRRKVLATALCVAIMAITMGFAAVAKTADASMKPRGNFRAFATSTNNNATKPETSQAETETSQAETETSQEETETSQEETETSQEETETSQTEINEDVAIVTDEASANEMEVPKAGVMDKRGTSSNAIHVSTEEELRNALQGSGKKVVLDDDIQVTEPLVVESGVDIAIDGGGHKVNAGEDPVLESMLEVESNAEVSFQNITINATNIYKQSDKLTDYYAIWTSQGSMITINEGTEIINKATPSADNKAVKGGIWLNGTGIMNGGKISGFDLGGVSVGKTAEFTLENGTIEKISVRLPDSDMGGGAINNLGTTIINGGTLSGNINGVFNSANLTMTGGKITNNTYSGIINNNEDHTSGEQYNSVATLSGGRIENNGKYALINRIRGKFTIDGAHISGEVFSAMRTFSNSGRRDTRAVVINSNDSMLEMISGEIVSNAANENAVYNDGTSKITMRGGTIAANGKGSAAIQNDNNTSGALDLQGGTVNGAVNTSASGGSSGSSGGSGGSGGGSGRIITNNTITKPAIPETPGSWLQDQTGWKFNAPNQTPYTNTWIRHNSQWYWIGTDGYMKTGWNQIAEKWYYLTPATGEMKTSWLQDGDTWYYLDETGAMKTGWVQVGTKWYYLNQDGKMAADTTTPDGYKVDGSGAWVK